MLSSQELKNTRIVDLEIIFPEVYLDDEFDTYPVDIDKTLTEVDDEISSLIDSYMWADFSIDISQRPINHYGALIYPMTCGTVTPEISLWTFVKWGCTGDIYDDRDDDYSMLCDIIFSCFDTEPNIDTVFDKVLETIQTIDPAKFNYERMPEVWEEEVYERKQMAITLIENLSKFVEFLENKNEEISRICGN